MRPPRTVSEFMAFIGRRQNVPIQLPPPVPAPILLIQPGVTTRSIPGFGVSPTPPPRNPAPAPQQPSSASSSSASSTRASSQPTSAVPRPSTSAPAAVSSTTRAAAPSNSVISSSINSPVDQAPTDAPAPAPTSANRGRPRPSSASPSPLPTGDLAGALPLTSTTGTLASDAMQPTESAGAPDRGSANADDSPESRGQQIGTIIGIIVGIGLLAGLIAMFCVRQANKKKAKKAAERPPTPDFISRPLARKDSNPWQGPIRTGPTAAGGDQWPMGAAAAAPANRNSMENARYDDKQGFAADRPGAPGAGGDRESLSKYQVINKINQHYATAERMSRAPGNMGPIAPPSPLFFKPVLANNNGARPDSMTFGGGGGQYAGGQYGGAPQQQGRY